MINGRISVATAAKTLRMDAQTVRLLLRKGNVSWGLMLLKIRGQLSLVTLFMQNLSNSSQAIKRMVMQNDRTRIYVTLQPY